MYDGGSKTEHTKSHPLVLSHKYENTVNFSKLKSRVQVWVFVVEACSDSNNGVSCCANRKVHCVYLFT